MAGSGAWTHRQLARGEYEIIQPDGRQHALVSFPSWETHPGSRIRDFVRVLAAVNGEPVDDGGRITGPELVVIDWTGELGWTSQAEHDDFLDDLRVRSARARASLGDAFTGYVATQMRDAEIPDGKGPYSVDQALELLRIVDRAVAVVAQDVAAEGVAA